MLFHNGKVNCQSLWFITTHFKDWNRAKWIYFCKSTWQHRKGKVGMLHHSGKGDAVYVLLIDRPASVYEVIGSRSTAKGNSVGKPHGTLLLLNLSWYVNSLITFTNSLQWFQMPGCCYLLCNITPTGKELPYMRALLPVISVTSDINLLRSLLDQKKYIL